MYRREERRERGKKKERKQLLASLPTANGCAYHGRLPICHVLRAQES